jgi:type IV secretory pathway protease TraF
MPSGVAVSSPLEVAEPAEDAPVSRAVARRRGLPKLPDPRPATVADPRPRVIAGPWRVAVADESMAPALEPGDWLLLDPTCARWPRRGSIVVVREPGSGILVIKRVAARPGDHVRTARGVFQLDADEAWLLGDTADRSIDSRRYGPVPLTALVGRAWFRYRPLHRLGRIGRRP